MVRWNPWHGCHKISEGCQNCYVYRIDGYHGRDAALITKTRDFNLPLKYTRNKQPKIPPGETVMTCFTSDFFLPEADEWRREIWRMIKIRNDLDFFIITKRIDRFSVSLPDDWGGGYDNVTIACTVENQKEANYRLPIYKAAPIKHKVIVCAPLLQKIDLSPFLGPWAGSIVVTGESGQKARVCDFDWVLDLRRQAVEHKIAFHYRQTGALLLKNGKKYRIPYKLQHAQAKKAGIDYEP